ncbi:hypothetical protein HispidOSU_022396 [Sigmodon hispidus]
MAASSSPPTPPSPVSFSPCPLSYLFWILGPEKILIVTMASKPAASLFDIFMDESKKARQEEPSHLSGHLTCLSTPEQKLSIHAECWLWLIMRPSQDCVMDVL